MQAIESLAAGARAAVTGALSTLGHVTGHDAAPVAISGVEETGYVGAAAICAAANKSLGDYLERRTTKARRGASRARDRCIARLSERRSLARAARAARGVRARALVRAGVVPSHHLARMAPPPRAQICD